MIHIREQPKLIKRESKEDHSIRMLQRKLTREKDYLEYMNSQQKPLILANISIHHMDYGMSPKEHEASKQQRKLNDC